MIHKWITGASYCLGEKKCEYGQIKSIEKKLEEYGFSANAEVLGLGYYYKTTDIYKLAYESIAQTLSTAGLSGDSIDSVVFCSSNFHHDLITQNRGFGRILIENGINPKTLICVCGVGCVSLLSGFESASAQMETQDIRRVLIVNIDHIKAKSDSERLIGFALLSDNVSSFILSDEALTGCSFGVSGFYKETNLQQMHDGINIKNCRKIQVIGPAIERAGLDIHDIDKVFGNNIFLPQKKVKEQGYGFSNNQLYLDNVSRTAHCLGSDTLINFSDYMSDRRDWKGNVLLYAEADGHAASLVVSR